MREAGVFNFEREVWKATNAPLLFIDDAQPAEPFAFIAIGPQRSIARPQPPHFVFGVPIIERRLNSLRQVRRQRKGLLIDVFRHCLDKIPIIHTRFSLDMSHRRNSARSSMFIDRKAPRRHPRTPLGVQCDGGAKMLRRIAHLKECGDQISLTKL